LDATHFRFRAARAREMAQSGDDVRLSQMLLEVALDLDAEAEAIEAKEATAPTLERRATRRQRPADIQGAFVHPPENESDTTPIWITNLSSGGAQFRTERTQAAGSKVVLVVPNHTLRLNGTIVRVRDSETAMVFDSTSRADPGLARLLRSETATA